MDLAALAATVQKHGRRARIVPEADAIVAQVAPEMRSGDVVAILSNGGFGGIYEKLPERLKAMAAARFVEYLGKGFGQSVIRFIRPQRLLATALLTALSVGCGGC